MPKTKDIDLFNLYIKDDKDFEYLHKEANLVTTGTMWDSTAEDLVDTKNAVRNYKALSVAEFYALYKVNLFFAILTSKVLDILHTAGGTQIPGTKLKVRIESDPQRPWMKRYRLNEFDELYIQEHFIITEPGKKDKEGLVYFILKSPQILPDLKASGQYMCDYKNSVMIAGCVDSNTSRVLSVTKDKLKDFNKSLLLDIFKQAADRMR